MARKRRLMTREKREVIERGVAGVYMSTENCATNRLKKCADQLCVVSFSAQTSSRLIESVNKCLPTS